MPPKGSKRILAGATQGERAVSRQAIGLLRENRVSQRSLKKYHVAVTSFLDFLVWNGIPQAEDMETLDQQLCTFLEALWTEGESKGMAGDVLSGAALYLNTRRVFPGAWRLFTVWGKLEVPNRVPPLPHLALAAMVGICVQQQQWGLGAGMFLAWHCILRTSEFVHATLDSVTLDPSGKGVIELGWTKGAQRKGATESCVIEDPAVGKCLSEAARLLRLKPTSLIIGMSPSEFRKWFDAALVTLGLQSSLFRPYSMRRGSATHDFVVFQNMCRTIERGRWSDIRTARIYVNASKAALADIQLSANSNRLIAGYAELARQWMLSL